MIIITNYDICENKWGAFCAGLWEKEELDKDGFKTIGWFGGAIRNNEINGEYKFSNQTNHGGGLFEVHCGTNGFPAEITYTDSQTKVQKKETVDLF